MTLSISTSGIAQEAMRLIGLDPGSSLADGSAKAVAAAEQYPLALQECLEAGDWSFASTLAELPEATLPEGAAADANLPYLYQLPGDCVRIQDVGDSWTSWRLDAIGLRASDEAPLTIRYTKAITTEASMSAAFRLYVSLNLALRLSPLYQGNVQKQDQLTQAYERQRIKALRQDARTASAARADDLDQADDWVDLATQ